MTFLVKLLFVCAVIVAAQPPNSGAPVAVASADSMQRATITGRVLDARSGEPLPAVEVVARRAADSLVIAHAASGADGRFALRELAPGRYLFRASLLGYVALAREVEVTAAGNDLGTLRLALAPVPMPEVGVTSGRSTVVVAPDRNLYLTKDMPAAASGTATDVLRAVPELDVDIDGRVSLKGSASVTIQIDGRPAPMKGDALTAYLRQFPASRIERVEVMSNPSAKYDPEGMAGIVNLVLKSHVDLGWSGSLSATAGTRNVSSSARVADQSGKVTFFAGVSEFASRYRSRLDDFRENLLVRPVSYYQFDAANRVLVTFGTYDASMDYAFTPRATLSLGVNGSLNTNGTDGRSRTALLDSALAATSRFDRTTDGDWKGTNAVWTLGFRHVVRTGRNERSVEARWSDNGTDNDSRTLKQVLAPEEDPDERSLTDAETGTGERSLQIDETRPLGARGKLEAGYKGWSRRNTSESVVDFFADDVPIVTPLSLNADYVHREVFHSGYLTLGSTFGRVSLQGGVRAEAADTRFEVTSTTERFENDYRSVFPSANVGVDLGKGTMIRLTYSKRIERPAAFYLNPYVPTVDPLNRTVGNPYLAPKYTHSFSLEQSWTTARGTLRLSPYYRETVNNWDQFKLVDTAGVAVTTWRNAASVRAWGGSVVASLRQTGKLGGSVSASVYRDQHDAGNLSSEYVRDATRWSANGNATWKANPGLDLQASVRYNPAQTLPQGRISALWFTNFGGRQKLGEKAWMNLWVNDPFDLWRYEFITRDHAHVQTSTNRLNIRSASLTFTWTFGKPPDASKRRPTTTEDSTTPQPDAPPR